MQEINSVELLIDYAKSLGVSYDTHRENENFYLVPGDPFLRSKYVIFKKDEFYVFAFDSYSAKAFMTKTFTGLFKATNLNLDYEFKIIKREWVHFLKANRQTTGYQYFDKKLTLTSSNNKLKITFEQQFINQFLNLNEQIQSLEMGIEKSSLPIIELRGIQTAYLLTNQWLYTTKDLDHLLNQGKELINIMVVACSQQRV